MTEIYENTDDKLSNENKDEDINVFSDESDSSKTSKFGIKHGLVYGALGGVVLFGSALYIAAKYAPNALYSKEYYATISEYHNRLDNMESKLALLSKSAVSSQELFNQETGPEVTLGHDIAASMKTEFNKLNVVLSNKIIAMLALMEIKELAEKGLPFFSELDVFSASVEKNSEIINTIVKLEAFADKKILSFAELLYYLENWENTATKTKAEDQKTESSELTEEQHVVSEVQNFENNTVLKTVEKAFDDAAKWSKKTLFSFVSVRPMKTEQLITMRMALSGKQGHLALETLEALPQKTQDSLAGWKQDLLRRIELDNTLRDLSKEFLANLALAVQPTVNSTEPENNKTTEKTALENNKN